MKKIITRLVTARTKVSMFILLTVLTLQSAIAQEDKKIDVNINTKSDEGFFMQPWVWIVGGAVFLLLLVALLRNNNRN